jgi:1,2-phenylacetyl-CoA epoxidase PaaB subunit
MDGLKQYRVMVTEDKGDKFKLAFDCWAEDDDHAAEQAQDAYPNGEIISVTQFADQIR